MCGGLSGREVFGESDPVPFLFSQLKILSHFYDSIEDVLEAGAFLLEDLDFRVGRPTSAILVLEPCAGNLGGSLELFGSLIIGKQAL